MIGRIAGLTRGEWFKLRRRWMPWILLVILLLFSQLGIWGAYFNYGQVSRGGEVLISTPGQAGPPQRISCAEILAQPPTLPAGVDAAVVAGLRAQCGQLSAERVTLQSRIYANFTLPGSIQQALGVASSMGTILIAVLAASTVGVEYGWGTMRTTLVRGTGRWQYLAGKLSMLMLVAFGALVVVVGVSAVSSVVAAGLVAPPPGFVAPAVGTAFEALGRAWFGMVPMIALVAMLTVLTASTATGMAIGIGYSIAEPLIMVLLGQLSDRFKGVSDYLLAANISAWNGGEGFGATASSLTSMHHFVVLLAYTVAFVGITAWLIESRDIAKATGT